MKRIKLILTVVGLTLAVAAGAQSQGQMRLNEYLVVNTDDFQDDFGQQSAWFELFNASYGTVDIGGCFLSDDPDNLKKYQIPGGDILTQVKPRQHVLFWADKQPFRGTFHVNFDLENANEIIFTKGDGKTIVDRIKVRHDLADNQSFGRVEDGIGSITGDGEGWAVMQRTSPSTNNSMVDKAAKPDRMKQIDPYGWILALTAMAVVFTALILLYLLFKAIGNANIKAGNKKAAQAAAAASGSALKTDVGEVPAETYAAIATAMHLYMVEEEAHDDESFVVTMNPVDRTYTPWSTHIQGFRQTPVVIKKK
ncbi:MAG: OadG family protein [Bacteroidales bacterium]|nr:OadG family protein [Bacteroidales bacterium]MBR5056840.1 OadG family protein [Bacteroidales bacterium]